ncbi:MAG: T9SS type A sorting domain-containing protein [Ignavibacteriae bacterium]|nr:T9SS type A sorting domain-containing protein [Ignavibacteria bacterium]MBI3364525.1 T9SS type A sorting domain-containing protein [Ignavibacteriota bacterium]
MKHPSVQYMIPLIIFVLLGTHGGTAQAWKHVGLDSSVVQSLAMRADSVLIAGVPTIGILRSTDQGATWALSDTADNVYSLAISSNGHIFAGLFRGSYHGIHRSTDDGLTWHRRDAFSGTIGDIHAFAFDMSGNAYAGGALQGILASSDEGASWDRIGSGLPAGAILSLAVAANGNIIAGTEDGLYRSTNSGNFWTQTNNASHATCLSLLAIDDGRVFAGTTGGGVYFSNNSGTSWTNSTAGLTSMNVSAIALNSDGILFAATSDSGVFHSENGGASWMPFSDGLTNTNINAMVIDQKGYLYAGTNGNGVFKTMESTVLSVHEISDRIPEQFSLAQNYPNPFNPLTNIQFQISHRSFVTLKIYNLLGNEVAKLLSEELQPGTYSTAWDASNAPTGVYFARLQAGTFIRSRKLVLLK